MKNLAILGAYHNLAIPYNDDQNPLGNQIQELLVL